MNSSRKRKNVIKRKGRINLIIVIICVLIITIISQKCLAQRQGELKEIFVNESDTLWNIAYDICYENEHLNIQNVIIEIKKINNLNTSDIYVGQKLFIPVY